MTDRKAEKWGRREMCFFFFFLLQWLWLIEPFPTLALKAFTLSRAQLLLGAYFFSWSHLTMPLCNGLSTCLQCFPSNFTCKCGHRGTPDLQGGDKAMLTQTEILELSLLDITCTDSQCLFSSNLNTCILQNYASLHPTDKGQAYKKLTHLLNKRKQ